jgi:hypothetical protein
MPVRLAEKQLPIVKKAGRLENLDNAADLHGSSDTMYCSVVSFCQKGHETQCCSGVEGFALLSSVRALVHALFNVSA